LFGLHIEVRHRLDEFARLLLAQRKRIIRTQRDVPGAKKIEQKLEYVAVMDERIDVDAFHVVARVDLIRDGTYIRPHQKPLLDTSERAGKSAAAVGEAHAQSRKPLEHCAENQRADCERSF